MCIPHVSAVRPGPKALTASLSQQLLPGAFLISLLLPRPTLLRQIFFERDRRTNGGRWPIWEAPLSAGSTWLPVQVVSHSQLALSPVLQPHFPGRSPGH